MKMGSFGKTKQIGAIEICTGMDLDLLTQI